MGAEVGSPGVASAGLRREAWQTSQRRRKSEKRSPSKIDFEVEL
jgi:hypothetical protein